MSTCMTRWRWRCATPGECAKPPLGANGGQQRWSTDALVREKGQKVISRLSGRVLERKPCGVILGVNGIGYEVLIPAGVMQSLSVTEGGDLDLVTYEYLQIDHARATRVLVGFRNELERDFFVQFITVASIGPRLAVRALAAPVSRIAQAIEDGDLRALQRLPGVGARKAKEIVAKLQGKAGRFCLICDESERAAAPLQDLEREAIELLVKVGHARSEAREMVERALASGERPETVEELLNLSYRKRSRPGEGKPQPR